MVIKKKRNVAGYWNESIVYLRHSLKYVYLIAFLFVVGALIGYFYPSNFSFLDNSLKELANHVRGMGLWQLTFFIFQNNLKTSLITMLFGVFLGITPIVNSLFNGAVLGYVLSKTVCTGGWALIFRVLPHGIFELPAVFISLGLGTKLGFTFISTYFRFYGRNKWKRAVGILSLVSGAVAVISFALAISTCLNTGSGPMVLLSTILGFLLIWPFVLFFFLRDSKLRDLQKKIFLERLYHSLRIYLIVVVPLLIIAAIIEGLLIIFL